MKNDINQEFEKAIGLALNRLNDLLNKVASGNDFSRTDIRDIEDIKRYSEVVNNLCDSVEMYTGKKSGDE